jgi:hypothetical protein
MNSSSGKRWSSGVSIPPVGHQLIIDVHVLAFGKVNRILLVRKAGRIGDVVLAEEAFDIGEWAGVHRKFFLIPLKNG